MKDFTDARNFILSTDEAKKLNFILPKGFKLVTQQQYKKKALSKPKKKTIMGLPATQQLVNTISLSSAQSKELNVSSLSLNTPNIIPAGRSTKTSKVMLSGYPSYQSIPQPINYQFSQNIPLNYQRKIQNSTSFQVYDKLKKHPFIEELQKVHAEPQHKLLSLKDIEKKVYLQRNNYEISQLVQDISKLCLKIYQSYSYNSNEYQNTVMIQKYLKTLTKVQKQESVLAQSTNISKSNQPSTLPALNLKKKPTINRTEFNSNNNAAVTIKQKRQLGQRIKKLSSQNLQHIIYILYENVETKQYSFDLDTLHTKKIRQLQDYVNSCIDNSNQYLKDNDQDNSKLNQQEQGQESSFIIQGDGQEQNLMINE